MFQALSFFTLLLAFLRAEAFFGHFLIHCQSVSPDGHDSLYLEQFFFNKKLMAQYNSTLGKVIGYTKKAQEIADILNKNARVMKHEKWKTDLCKSNTPLFYDDLLTTVEPDVWLKSVKAASRRHPGLLVCSAYNFYPRQITVTWLRNGKVVTADVTSTEELSNGNWLYQIHSYLEFTPTPGEKITCMVEHASLMEPKLYTWGKEECMSTEPTADYMTYKIAVGSVGLLLGLTFSVAGLIYYKRRSTARVLVPTTEVLEPEHTL